MIKPLRLLIQDAEDLSVVSAALQDAVGKVGDIEWRPAERTLTLALNRYCWEAGGRKKSRVRSGLQFGGVLSVKSRNLRRDAPEGVISLLAVQFEPQTAPGGVISLIFAGGGDLRLEVECLDGALSDLGEPWDASGEPSHTLD